jgi:biotin carboxyl carrier protein
MTDPETDLGQVELAAREIVPKLAARLGSQGLGELEVRRGSLRVRVVGSPKPAMQKPATDGSGPGQGRKPADSRAQAARTNHGVTSPAVGYFGFAEGLGPGLAVNKGDSLGNVDMLGVRHEVRAPRRGTVRNLVAEAGEPVEYGQVLLELEPAE